MSTVENKWRPLIIGLVLVLFISAVSLSGVAGGGGTTAITGCNNPSSLEQCGTSSCFPSGSPVESCGVTITFSPAFAAVPKFASAEYTGCNPSCHEEIQAVPQGTVVVQSDNGETWLNMPAAVTEIYGTTNHETSFTSSAATNEATLAVTCITGSGSGTAVLRPQYSIDGGTSWNNLAQTPGGLDLAVDSGTCGFSASPAFSTNVAGIAPAARGAPAIYRIVGQNGNGVGDNVVFNNVELQFYSISSEIYMTCIAGTTFPSQGCAGDPVISKTSMTVRITRMLPAVSGPGTAVAFNWMAME